MKKITAFIIVISMMLAGNVVMASSEHIIANQDFDSLDEIALTSTTDDVQTELNSEKDTTGFNWDITALNGAQAAIRTDSQTGSQVVYFTKNTATARMRRQMNMVTSVTSGTIEYSVDLKFDKLSTFRLQQNNSSAIIEFDTSGNVWFFDGNDKKSSSSGTYSAGEWISVKFVMDLTGNAGADKGNTYSATINGATPVTGTLTQGTFTGIRYDFYNTSTAGEAVSLDNIMVNRPVLEFEESSINDGTTGFSVNGEIEFIFNEEITSVDEEKISVIDIESELPADFAVSANDSVLKISFAENMLDFETEYLLTIEEEALISVNDRKNVEEVTLSFETMEESLVCGNVYFETAEEDGEALESTANATVAYAKVDITNFTSDEESAVIIVNVYGEDGFERTVTGTGTVDVADEETIFAKVEACQGKTLKAVCISDTDSFKVINEKYGVLDASGYTLIADNSTVSNLTVSEKATTGEDITVNITAGSRKESIVVAVKNNGVLRSAEIVETANDGTLSYTYKVSASEIASESELSFDIIVNSRLAAERKGKTVKYMSNTLRGLVKDAVNGAMETSDVRDALSPYISYTGISTALLEDSEALEIILAGKPYETLEDIALMFVSSGEIKDKLSSLTWNDVTEFLEENGEFILGDIEEYEAYKKLNQREKNKVNQKLCNYENTTSMKVFKENFKNAYKEYLAETKKSESFGGGGGGGSSPTPSVNNPPRNEESTSEDSETVIPEKPDTAIFSDTENVKWANEAITSLAEKGVLSGYPDGTFKPESNVKKEEFIKMLVVGFGLTAGQGENNFADCEEGVWYENFVNIAHQTGILQGDPNGNFGAGKDISRQDVAVMVWRVVKQSGKTFPVINEEAVFTDSESISDYAKEAVFELTKAGILSGMGDGSFKPANVTNRAQVAKIIYEVCGALTEDVK